MIPITTPKAPLKCGQNRVIILPKVLLLHGGPGLTHELYECFDGYFPNESIEYIYYDQLGS
jgi:proline iminopeptidase